MPSNSEEKVPSKGHTASDKSRRSGALVPFGIKFPDTQTIVANGRHKGDNVALPFSARFVITAQMVHSLCEAWACLNLAKGNEMHLWHLSEFNLSLEPDAQVKTPSLIELLQKESFDGIHACVFADGDVSFYLVHESEEIIFLSKTFPLTQFWIPDWL
ncbi:MAG: hypothetical protein ACK4F8_11680 [Aquabacterium sp.]